MYVVMVGHLIFFYDASFIFFKEIKLFVFNLCKINFTFLKLFLPIMTIGIGGILQNTQGYIPFNFKVK